MPQSESEPHEPIDMDAPDGTNPHGRRLSAASSASQRIENCAPDVLVFGMPQVLHLPSPGTPEKNVTAATSVSCAHPPTETARPPRLSLSQPSELPSARCTYPQREDLDCSKTVPAKLGNSAGSGSKTTDGDKADDVTFSNSPEKLRDLARQMLLSTDTPQPGPASPWVLADGSHRVGETKSPWFSTGGAMGMAAMAAAESPAVTRNNTTVLMAQGESPRLDSAASPFLTELNALDVPDRSDADDKSDVIDTAPRGVRHVVHQSTSVTGKPTFELHMLSARLNDSVVFHWYDPSARIVETDSSYQRLLPGGLHSKAGAASVVKDGSDDEDSNGAGSETSDAMLFSRSQRSDQDTASREERFGAGDGCGRRATDASLSLAQPYRAHCVYDVHLTKPGTRFFVCTLDSRRMRLRVLVEDHRTSNARHIVTAILLLLLAVCVVVVVVLVLAFWLKRKDLFLSREDASSEGQYMAIHKLQDLITVYLFPWLATGIMIFVVLILFGVAYAIYRCLRPRDVRREAQSRGFSKIALKVSGWGCVVLCIVITVLLFVAYGVQLNVTNGLNLFAQQLGESLQFTVQNYSGTLNQVNWLVNESEVLFPSVDIPRATIEELTGDVMRILNQSSEWVVLGQDAIQGAFRVLPILLFLTLQLGLFVSALTIGEVGLKYRNTAVTVTWLVACCIGVMACACGVVWAESKLLSLIYNSAVIIGTSPETATAQFGIAEDSFISQLFSYCSVSSTDVSDIVQYVKDIVSNINASMDCEQQQSFAIVANFIDNLTPLGIDALVNYSDYIQANVNSFDYILANNPSGVDAFFKLDVVNFLQVAVNVIATAYSLVNCNILKELIGNSIPILRRNVEHNNTALFVILLILFGVTVVQLVFAVLFVLFLSHPRKWWYEARTGRWFRFRYSYVIHRHMLLLDAETIEAKKANSGWRLAWLRRAQPVMYNLLNARLVMYASSTLMFFDCILLVLFNNLARTIADAPLITAMSYLGCVQLILILGSALFRVPWLRVVLWVLCFLVVIAVFVLSVVQLVLGYVHFGNCLHDARYAYLIGQLASGHDISHLPQYLACPITYVGHELEVAVYATVMFLNCITLGVTLMYVIVHYRFLEPLFQRRPYKGILLPLASCGTCFRRLFKDHLRVRRVAVGILIVIIIVILVLFAVLNGSKEFRLIRTVRELPTADTLLQVFKPTVACNGEAAFCDLRVNEMIWACTHNAHSSLEDHFLVGNHYFNITRQLHSGIRSFMIDLWYDKIDANVSDEQDVYLCHGVCVAGRRPFRIIAAAYADFLETYPDQVIMLILEQYVNDTDIATVMDDVGLTKFVWYSDQEPPSVNPDYLWPTLGEMIQKNQRLMMFNDAKSNSVLSVDRPDWMYYAYAFQYENDYQTDDVSEWRCKVGRGWCNSLPDLTSDDKANTTTSGDSGACPTTTTTADPNAPTTTTTVGPEPEPTTTTTQSPEEIANALREFTNCSDDSGPWDNGSDVYNAALGRQPPLVGRKLSTLNHMITVGIGSPMKAVEANLPDSIRYNTYRCSSTWNQIINILAYDYWSIDNPLAVIYEMNKNIIQYGPAHDFKDQWKLLLFGDANANVVPPPDEVPM